MIRSAQQLHMMFKNFSFSAFEMKNERLIEVLCQSRDWKLWKVSSVCQFLWGRLHLITKLLHFLITL